MRELKLSSPLNIQIITEPERMALRIALDKSIGENLGMVLALKDTKREIPQGLYNSGLDYLSLIHIYKFLDKYYKP